MPDELTALLVGSDSHAGQLGQHDLFEKKIKKNVQTNSSRYVNQIYTFLNTNGASSYTGFIPFSRTHLVRNFLRTVSAGRPNMSTSTYVPIFLSLRNWPDSTVTETVPAIMPSTLNCERNYHTKYINDLIFNQSMFTHVPYFLQKDLIAGPSVA